MTDDIAMFNAGVATPRPRVSRDAAERAREDARLRREADIQRRLHEIRQAAVHAFKVQR